MPVGNPRQDLLTYDVLGLVEVGHVTRCPGQATQRTDQVDGVPGMVRVIDSQPAQAVAQVIDGLGLEPGCRRSFAARPQGVGQAEVQLGDLLVRAGPDLDGASPLRDRSIQLTD
jgi:hypothetical protein